MRPLWSDLLDATGPDGQGFAIRGEEVFRRCLICDALFPQTDDGWRALKDHGLEEHERPTTFKWGELHGLDVTLAVVERPITEGYFKGKQLDLLARGADGTVYFLFSKSCQPDYDGGVHESGWKCRPKSPESNLLRLMQGAAASPSHG